MFEDAEMLLFDDDFMHNVIWNEPGRRPRWIPERNDYFNMYDQVDFIRCYRLSKRTALSVLEKIEEKLEFHSNKLRKVKKKMLYFNVSKMRLPYQAK